VSDFRVLQEISRFLRRLLFDGLSGNEIANGAFSSIGNISLASPEGLSDDNNTSGTLLSLYLYQVVPDTQLNNHPLIPAGAGRQVYPPLSLVLHYLLTPLSTSPDDNLVILGRAMQVLAATPIIRANFLDSTLRLRRPEVRVMVNPVTLEELTRIWNAFNQPYRLSLCYQVQVVSIDSVRAPEEGPPVAERYLDIHKITPRSEEP
jgi:hypothetical protein